MCRFVRLRESPCDCSHRGFRTASVPFPRSKSVIFVAVDLSSSAMASTPTSGAPSSFDNGARYSSASSPETSPAHHSHPAIFSMTAMSVAEFRFLISHWILLVLALPAGSFGQNGWTVGVLARLATPFWSRTPGSAWFCQCIAGDSFDTGTSLLARLVLMVLPA